MSIASAITAAQGKVANAYTAVSNKGGTLPATQDLSNLPTAISSIPSGSGPTYYVEKTVVNGQLRNSTNIINLNGVTDIGTHALMGAYFEVTFPANTSIDMSDITMISGAYACQDMFYYSTGLTSVDLSALTTISGNYACERMFSSCTGLTSVNLSALTTISGGMGCSQMFASSADLTSVDLSALTTIDGGNACTGMFSVCSGMTNIDLSSLTTISGNNACTNMFSSCSGLTAISFPSLREILPTTTQNQFNNMFASCPNLTEIHFPSNTQSRVEQLTGYSTQFGATNATVLFDLPATL